MNITVNDLSDILQCAHQWFEVKKVTEVIPKHDETTDETVSLKITSPNISYGNDFVTCLDPEPYRQGVKVKCANCEEAKTLWE